MWTTLGERGSQKEASEEAHLRETARRSAGRPKPRRGATRGRTACRCSRSPTHGQAAIPQRGRRLRSVAGWRDEPDRRRRHRELPRRRATLGSSRADEARKRPSRRDSGPRGGGVLQRTGRAIRGRSVGANGARAASGPRRTSTAPPTPWQRSGPSRPMSLEEELLCRRLERDEQQLRASRNDRLDNVDLFGRREVAVMPADDPETRKHRGAPQSPPRARPDGHRECTPTTPAPPPGRSAPPSGRCPSRAPGRDARGLWPPRRLPARPP